MRNPINSARRLIVTASVAITTLGLGISGTAQAEELNGLVWCDHLDPELIRPFEEKHDVTVNLREYQGTGTALAMIEQSRPGDWDVFVVDSTDVRRVVEQGILAPMDAAGFPFDDIPDAVLAPDLHEVDGKLYAVPEKFGYNTVAFDNSRVDPADMRKASVAWNADYAGRVAIYDYYLPIIAQVAVALGKNPRELTEADLPDIRERLFAIKENAAMVSDIVSSQTALATGEVDVLYGGGEFAVSVLAEDKPNLDWVLPEEGGIRWQQAIGVFADSGRKELAGEFVRYILSPDAQAKLATSSCYWGMPANQAAPLDEEQKRILRWDEQPGYIENSYTYPVVTSDFDRQLQDLWTEFLQH